MTTTSGNAAMVLAWLEEWLQTEWLDLRVRLTSVTEQFATVSLCGPNVRKLMRELTRGIELSPEAFPHMSMQEGEVAGIPARIARVSFTGEVGFEVNVPANSGLARWEASMNAGEKHHHTPYGHQAMPWLGAQPGSRTGGTQTGRRAG